MRVHYLFLFFYLLPTVTFLHSEWYWGALTGITSSVCAPHYLVPGHTGMHYAALACSPAIAVGMTVISTNTAQRNNHALDALGTDLIVGTLSSCIYSLVIHRHKKHFTSELIRSIAEDIISSIVIRYVGFAAAHRIFTIRPFQS